MKIFLAFFLFLVICNPVVAGEKSQVLFINQVRGEECCAEGSLKNLENQINAFKKARIPAYFAFRYDALIDDRYMNGFQKMRTGNESYINAALLIEITPKLAKDAGVVYRGSSNRWFEAQNVYTIGYKKDDRQKIIDKLFFTFKKNFGVYPQITSSWIIDTDSLNYIRKKFGTIAHQITREQWGTDSYTLYGGPPHYPYPASRSWAFIPDFKEKDPLLMLRQTVDDPLYNYGETKKAYTSQPNDYLNAGLDFEYFKKLVDQALFEQKTTGFALLGLENSYEDIYQEEYLRQINYVSSLKDRITFPSPKALKNFWRRQTTTYYHGKDLIAGSANEVEYEVTGDHRMRSRKYGGKKYITDYRYYDSRLTDLYNDYMAKKSGYWVTPYDRDYSREYEIENSIFPELRNDLSIVILPKLVLGKFNAKKFNATRPSQYPYYFPEPIEREISPKKSQLKIEIKRNDIAVDFLARDEFGYPVNIAAPLTIFTDPRIDNISYQPDSARHIYTIARGEKDYLLIKILSDKKTIKTIYLFPRLLPFLKISI